MIHAFSRQRLLTRAITFISKKVLQVVFLCFVVVHSTSAFSATKAGIEFDELVNTSLATGSSATTNPQPLILNGLGVRTKLIFKVYVAGLYLSEKSADADKILASDSTKFLKLHFLRDVEAAKIKEAWAEGFEKNCLSECEAGKALVMQLGSLMRDMKENDTLEFTIAPSSVVIRIKGSETGRVEGYQFGKNILAIFLGKNPPNKELKEGLLGK